MVNNWNIKQPSLCVCFYKCFNLTMLCKFVMSYVKSIILCAQHSVSVTLASYQMVFMVPCCQEQIFEQRVTKSVLLRMREDQMVVLSQFLGDQVILWDEICKENAASSGTSGASQSVLATTSASSASQSVPAATSASSASQSAPATTSASSAPSKRKLSQASSSGLGVNAANKKIASVSNLRFSEEFDLRYFLENDSVGEVILDALNKEDEGPENFFLSERQRDCLVEILIKHIKDNTVNFEYKLLAKFAEKIETLFPTENANTFFCPPKTDGPHQTTAKGKLFNKLKNSKSSNKSLASCGSNPTPQNIRQDTSSGLQAILDQSITEESLGAETWLASNRSPWTKVLEKWALTAPLRFKYLFNTEDTFANTYIDRWPVLAHKSGFELLTADFDLLYPGKGDSLFVRWPSFASRTISLAKKDIRDETGKKLLALYLNCEESNTRGQNATLISLLSSIRPSHRRPEVGKVSSLSSRESYILHLTSALELRNIIKKHRTEKLANVCGGGQPLIIVIGPTITKVNKIYVSISELLYEVPCVLSALDICFKSFFSLHMRYPPESGHVWLTLQRVLYKFSTEWDVKGDLKQSWIDFYKF